MIPVDYPYVVGSRIDTDGISDVRYAKRAIVIDKERTGCNFRQAAGILWATTVEGDQNSVCEAATEAVHFIDASVAPGCRFVGLQQR